MRFSNIAKIVILPFGVTAIGLYSTGHLEDAYYLLGGIRRGMRCAIVGSQIAHTYISVTNKL
jgi:hypothetical protein